jgi:hypothetical protein
MGNTSIYQITIGKIGKLPNCYFGKIFIISEIFQLLKFTTYICAILRMFPTQRDFDSLKSLVQL